MTASAPTIKEVRIADFCTTGSGGTPSRAVAEYFGGTIPWVKSGELRESVITATEEHITQAGLENSAAKLLPADTLLVALYGATVGRIGILGIEATTNQAVCHIIPKNGAADVRYLFYALQSKVDYWLNKRVGGGQPNISQGVIKDTLIPLPPLAEQKRIARILDAADALRAKRREALAQLDTLLQATFLDLFGDPVTNPKGWDVLRMGEISSRILSGNTPKGGEEVYVPEGVTFFRSQNVWRNRIDLDDIAYIDEATHRKMAKSSLKNRDILITKTGRLNTENSSLGRAAMFIGQDDSANINGHVYLVRLKPGVIHEFVLFILTTSEYREYIRRVCVGAIDKRQINKEHLEEFPIITPPIELQHRFAALVKASEQQRLHFRAHLAELDTLFASLQSRAFKGEL